MKGLRIAVLAAATTLVFAPRAHALDIEPYIKKDAFNSIVISPKGEYFAATIPLEDQTVLAIIRRSDNRVLSKFGMGKNTVVNGFRWVNPQRVIFSMAEKFGALDRPSGTGELFAMDADGKQPELLVGWRVETNTGSGAGSHIQAKKVEAVAASLLDDLPEDDRSVLIEAVTFGAEFPRVEKMDVYTGRRVRVASAPVRAASFMTDNAGVVRFAHGAEYDRAGKLYYREGDGVDWRLVNDESATGLDQWPIGFSADNKTAYLEAESKSGPDRVIAWNPADGSSRDLLVDDEVDPSGFLYEAGTGVPVGAFYEKGQAVSRFFDPNGMTAKLQKALEQAFPGSTVYVTSRTDDGNTALVHVDSDRNPGDYYLFDTRTLKASYLLSDREWFDPDLMNPSTPIQLVSRDGLPLHGYLTRPRGSEGKRVPLVVLPHGGPFGVRDSWEFDTETQVLASAGYAVLQVNYRGSGGYGRAFQEAGRRQWGKTMQDDLTDATRWAVSQGIADGSKICIYGASYGAYAALMGAAKEPGLYRCAVGYVGVYDMPALYTDGDGRHSAYTKTFLTDWVGPREEIAATSPTRLADRIKAPVLLAAGGEDETAPIEHSKMMERALLKASVPVETLYVPTEGHGFYTPEHQREFYTRLLAFLSKHLGGDVVTPPAARAASAR